MLKWKSTTSSNPAQAWIILGIPVLFIIGAHMHFAYEWSGKSTIIGIFAPVNESVWEHLKMSFWPMLIWWVVGFSILTKRINISASGWFVSCAVAEVICCIVIVSFYYTYTGAFGIESIILDVFSLFLGITVGQLMALHVYKYAKNSKHFFPYAIAILMLMGAAFIIFTFCPPQIPLFMESNNL
jgi:hypothetical protein